MNSLLHRGVSKTSPRRGRQSLGGGRQPNILVIFSEKPYEIKEILVRRGARQVRPPKSATVLSHQIGIFSRTDKWDDGEGECQGIAVRQGGESRGISCMCRGELRLILRDSNRIASDTNQPGVYPWHIGGIPDSTSCFACSNKETTRNGLISNHRIEFSLK